MVSDAIVVATDNVQANEWGDLTGAFGATAGQPYLAAPTMLFNKFTTDRAAGFFRAAEGRIAMWDLLAPGAMALGAGVRTMAAGLTFIGVAARAAKSGEAVPVLTSGLVRVRRVAGQTLRVGDRLTSSSIDPAAVSAALPGAPSIGTWSGGEAGETGIIELRPPAK